MRSILAFLAPSRLKLLFLAEWGAIFVGAIALGELRDPPRILAAAAPFTFYYVVGCALVALSRRARPLPHTRALLAWSLAPVIADQGAKSLVGAMLPPGATIPVLRGVIELDHARNPYGSWLLSLHPVHPAWLASVLLWGTVAFFLALSLIAHRYYSARHRRSVWADVAFLGLFSAMLCWILDMSLRGYILDFIGIPGLFTADLKDVALGIGAMAIFAEGLDNPALERGGPGWRDHVDQSWALICDLWRFAEYDLCKLARRFGAGSATKRRER